MPLTITLECDQCQCNMGFNRTEVAFDAYNEKVWLAGCLDQERIWQDKIVCEECYQDLKKAWSTRLSDSAQAIRQTLEGL